MSLDPGVLSEPTTWDLESIVAGGPDGGIFATELAAVEDAIADLGRTVGALGAVRPASLDAWAGILQQRTALDGRLSTLMSFASCSFSADTTSEGARLARERVLRAIDGLRVVLVDITASLDEAEESSFQALIQRSDMAAERAMLEHDRRRRALRLPRREQALAAALNPHAIGGWGSVYSELSGRLKAQVELPDGTLVERSAGQLHGMLASPDANTRRRAHTAAEALWRDVSPTCARALGHITGARAAINAQRGVDELADTCGRNRIERATLDALWAASEHARPRLQAFLARKASLAGLDRLAFWEVRAPLAVEGVPEVSWSQACTWIVEAFASFDPEMAQFAVRAIEGRWVEAEDRSGKRPGGFCSRASNRGESRIFMTWSNTKRAMFTLAHELGHAWHNEILFRQPAAQRRIISATAETASTFAEALLRDYLLERASNDQVRLAMLDEQGVSGVGLLLDIEARYLFERELYRMSERGPLTPDGLDQAMIAAQEQAFGPGTLAGYDPTFWCSKLHFYIAHFGFYNWPYAFGYLFSQAVYARAKVEGPAYAATFRRLLAVTGHMWTEDAVNDVLGADTRDPDFWIGATAPMLSAVDAFLDETA